MRNEQAYNDLDHQMEELEGYHVYAWQSCLCLRCTVFVLVCVAACKLGTKLGKELRVMAEGKIEAAERQARKQVWQERLTVGQDAIW